MMIPALVVLIHSVCTKQWPTKYIARVLNLPGVDRDLFNTADSHAFLDLIDEYLDESQGITPPISLTLQLCSILSLTNPFNIKIHSMYTI